VPKAIKRSDIKKVRAPNPNILL